MANLQVLVVDDSSVVRSVVSSVLEDAPDMEVAGVAGDGAEAFEQLERQSVDCIVLDVQMPGMDGLDVLDALREHPSRAAVVLFSTATRGGAPTTIEGLLKGADAYVPKPRESGGLEEAADLLRQSLLPKIRSVATSRTSTAEAKETGRSDDREPPETDPFVRPPHTDVSPDRPVDAVGIAVSTGGPSVVASTLELLPPDFDAPILIAQHMPPEFTSKLAERLNRSVALEVREARDGEPLESGTALLAPGDRHLKVEEAGAGAVVRTVRGQKRNACRPSGDILFETLADVFGAHALAIVMTGMGSDGRAGSLRLHEVGGRVVAQDRASSVVWGMPRGPVEAEVVEKITDPEGIAHYLIELVESS